MNSRETGLDPKAHDEACSDVLDRVYAFIDRELDENAMTYDQISAHLETCRPCLEEYDLDRVIKQILARSCQCERTPDEVRVKVLARIRSVQVHITD